MSKPVRNKICALLQENNQHLGGVKHVRKCFIPLTPQKIANDDNFVATHHAF